MIGRKVESRWHGIVGTVIAWEPLGAALTDTLVQREGAGPIWVASSDLAPADGAGPLPSRKVARLEADKEALRSLEAIRARHVAEFARPWPGLEFGKAHLGQALDGAISELKGRRRD